MGKQQELSGTSRTDVVDILIVEDSPTQADRLAFLLGQDGYACRMAENGRLALEAVRAARPTLIISDIVMPEMDGYTLCRTLKDDPQLQDIPVILLTSLTSLHDIIKGLDCGADNFIRKPFEERYLLNRIRFILANRSLDQRDRVQLGMRINLGGQTHFINAERQQIFDLLISTYEEAILMTEELRAQQTEIARSYQSLEGLYRIAEGLNPLLKEQDVADRALERALELPGVVGGWIRLADGDDTKTVALQTLQATSDGPASCACIEALRAGNLPHAAIMPACACLPGDSPLDEAAPLLAIPLRLGEQALGVMNLLHADAETLDDEALRVFETVGHQVAAALERARLYHNLEFLVEARTAALLKERNLLSAVFNNSGALVLLIDPAGRIIRFNRGAEEALGWMTPEAEGQLAWELLCPPGEAEAARLVFSRLDPKDPPIAVSNHVLTRGGDRREILWSVNCIGPDERTIEYVLSTGIDVTELRAAEERVRYLSNYEELTGLPNKILLRDRAKWTQERLTTGKGLMAFMHIELERLPVVREGLGPAAEQAVLRQAAQRLKGWAHNEDTAAHLRDGVFAALVVRPRLEDLSLAAQQLSALLEPPYDADGQEVHAEPYIGITVFPNDSDNFDALAQGAEVAARRAITTRASRHSFYTPDLNRGSSERLKLEIALRHALTRDELLLHYQPQVDLRSGDIIGVEALVRWQHPELGLVPPDRFIGLAEETGLILPLGEWVLQTACRQNKAWCEAGIARIPVAVNLSAKQFGSNIATTVDQVLAATGLPPELLDLELTESLSMEDPASTFDILDRLKRSGVHLSIDDFGTGYSNLNYLKRFPVDKLKLDKSFVRDLTSSPDDMAIAEAVIAMGHSLRLRVIAEGVETEGQLALLGRFGCDEMQGYYFSRPVDAEACEQLLRSRAALPLDKLERLPYRRTLLLVDDEANVTSALRRTLRGSGYTLLTANDAVAAFELLATAEVGVILCDQRMPGTSGTEFLARVKHMYPRTVRIILSGYTDLKSVVESVNQGSVFKFLTKPWDDEELKRVLDEAFASYEAANAPRRATKA